MKKKTAIECFPMTEEQNAMPVMLPLTAKSHILDYFVNACDGFLFTGGYDVSPKFYSAARHKKAGFHVRNGIQWKNIF